MHMQIYNTYYVHVDFRGGGWGGWGGGEGGWGESRLRAAPPNTTNTDYAQYNSTW